MFLAITNCDRWRDTLLRGGGHKWTIRVLPVQNVQDWVDVKGLEGPLLCQSGLIMTDLYMLV